MKSARQHFDANLAFFRKYSIANGLEFLEVLLLMIQNPSPIGLIYRLGGHSLKPREDEVIQRYKSEFYERLADHVMEEAEYAVRQRNARKAGGIKRGAQIREQAATNRARVLAGEKKLLLAGMKEHHITKRLSTDLNLEISVVRKNRSKERKKKTVSS